MSLESFINQFGYVALVLGLLVEGETILVLAAFLAHRGHLELFWVILISILVEFVTDQFYFWLGYTKGSKFLKSKPKWEQKVSQTKSLLERNTNILFLTFQFMYGLRIIIPLVSGMNKVNYKKFFLLNFAGVTLWAMFYGMAGYLFGQVVEVILEEVAKYELWVILCMVSVGGIIFLYRNRGQIFNVKAGSNESPGTTQKSLS